MSSNGDSHTDKLFDLYLHNYMIKRKMYKTAEIFRKEANISRKEVAVDSPAGILHDWWTIFYDVYRSRETQQEANVAASDQASTFTEDDELKITNPLMPEFLMNQGSNGRFPRGSEFGAMPRQLLAGLYHEQEILQPDSLLHLCDITASNFCTPAENSSRQLTPSSLAAKQYDQGIFPADSLLHLCDTTGSKFSAPAENSSRQLTPSLLAAKQHEQEIFPPDPLLHLIDTNASNFSMPPESSSSSNIPHQVCGPHLANFTGENGTKWTRVLSSMFEEAQNVTNKVLGQYGIGQGAVLGPFTGINPRVANSPLESTDVPRLLPKLLTEPQRLLLSQILSRSSANRTPALTGSPSEIYGQHSLLPTMVPTGDFNYLMPLQMRQNTEILRHRHQLLQQPLVESGGERNIERRSGAFENTILCHSSPSMMECTNNEGLPGDRVVDPFLSGNVNIAESSNCPLTLPKHPSTASTENENKGFSLEEIGCLNANRGKVLCCDFSSDGRYLVSGGHEKKVFVWNMETKYFVATSEGHSRFVTDVSFKPNSTIFASSSLDKTLNVWDASKTRKTIFQFCHDCPVTSLDFHPENMNLMCSCDINDVITFWDMNTVGRVTTVPGATRRVRFQPKHGKLLATATANLVNIFEQQTFGRQFSLMGHRKEVRSVCWDATGEYVASVSEDSARVWSIASGGRCMHELPANCTTFHSCIFHPRYPGLLIIGGDKSLELWKPDGSNQSWTIPAHFGPIAALAESQHTKMMASASHDKCIKLWK